MTKEIVLVIGYPASGKSTYALNNFPTHHRVNRDILGGKIAGLVPYIEKKIEEGVTSFVLDNTHVSVGSRKLFVDLAKKHKFSIRCHWMHTSAEDAQFNACLRMVKKYGKVLDDAEMVIARKAGDPNIFPVNVIFSYRKSFEAPTYAEGYDEIVAVPFKRTFSKEYVNKALILDYDGTLRDTFSGNNYPREISDIKILPGRTQILDAWKRDGYHLLGVSNQSGVHKGILTKDQVTTIFEKTNELLGHDIDYRFCPHASGALSCYCRKPGTGFGAEFIEKYKLNPSACTFVGDLGTDRSFAERCGFAYIESEKFFRGS